MLPNLAEKIKKLVADEIEKSPCSQPTGHVRIIIGQRGWVWVGREVSRSDREVVMFPSRCVRIWGTTKGLAEIANDGPTSKTVLDVPSALNIHPLAIVATLVCKEEPWNKHLC